MEQFEYQQETSVFKIFVLVSMIEKAKRNGEESE